MGFKITKRIFLLRSFSYEIDAINVLYHKKKNTNHSKYIINTGSITKSYFFYNFAFSGHFISKQQSGYGFDRSPFSTVQGGSTFTTIHLENE